MPAALDITASLISALVFFWLARGDVRDGSPRLAIVGGLFCAVFLANAILCFFRP